MQYTSVIDQLSSAGSATTWPGSTSAIDLPHLDDVLPCQDASNTDLWFAEGGEDVERAKALCVACPLQASCLAGALERAEPWGVWGGEVFVDGQIVARKRGRGRPRKDDPYRQEPSRTTSAA